MLRDGVKLLAVYCNGLNLTVFANIKDVIQCDGIYFDRKSQVINFDFRSCINV
ncbi:hypothetical protein IMSAG025_02026 [Muribaculaceae bacterium]|nr:hypothetical protein IMSAG025_02026 [Muribaculaceae bacterium]